MALKKKKLYQNQLEAVENNMLRVSEQQMGLENLRTTVEAVDALRTGAHASKATMQVRRGCRGGLEGGFGWMEARQRSLKAAPHLACCRCLQHVAPFWERQP